MDDSIPRFITYIPGRAAGKWRMHETVGHLRNALSMNGWHRSPWGSYNQEAWEQYKAAWVVYEMLPGGMYFKLDIPDIFKEDFK